MSELQIGLLALGAAAIAGVFGYNWLQERRARRAAQRAFRSGAGDALLEAPAPGPGAAAPPEARPSVARAAPRPPQALPDARLDYVVELEFAEPIAAARLLELWKAHEHRYAKRALLAGCADGAHWARLQAGEAESLLALRAGLQLASREGAVGEAELIEFRAAVDSLAAACGARITAPEMRQAVEQARALDAFCADADIQVVLHVMPQSGADFDEVAVSDAAEEAGLALEGDGRFTLRDAEGRELFALMWRDGEPGTTGLSLTLDVPRAPGGRAAFQSMARFGRELAATLDGSLVDDNGQRLEERALAAIDAQLGAVHAAFAGRGIEPGSLAALRLFA